MKISEIYQLLVEGAFKYPDVIKHKSKYITRFVEDVSQGKDIILAGSKPQVSVQIKKDKTFNKLKKLLAANDVESIETLLRNTNFMSSDNTPISWTKIEKTPYSVGFGDKKFNRGDVSEGIMGAALTAKFKSPDTSITTKDVQEILKNVATTNDGKMATAEWTRKSATSGKDKIKFEIILKISSMEALLDKENWVELDPIFAAAVKYANSKFVSEYALMLDTNGTDDTAHIKSIGSLDEKGTKVDLQVLIGLNKQTPTKTNINISLKTGKTKNLEQSGITYEAISTTLDKLGININGFKKPFVKEESWYAGAFEYAVEKLNTGFLSSASGEKKFVQKIGEAIRQFATKNEDVVKIQLGNGDYKVFSYTKLPELINKFDLEAYYVAENARPSFVIKDKSTGKILISFRLEVRAGNNIFKLHIESGDMLDELTRL